MMFVTTQQNIVACISPHTRRHILRFGKYGVDMADLPDPLDPQLLPFEQNL